MACSILFNTSPLRFPEFIKMDPKDITDLLSLFSMLAYVTMPIVNQSKTVISHKTIIFISSAVRAPQWARIAVSIVTRYGLDSPGIESQRG
jgi:hypothetical protein